MAKVGAAAFRRGLRFRPHMPGECAASECGLFCDDLHRAGLRRILIDPIVTTAYSRTVKAAIHAAPRLAAYANLTQIKITDWADLGSPGARLDWGDARWAVDYGAIECCPLTEGRETVDWELCHRRGIMPNASAAAGAAVGANSGGGGAASGGARGNFTADFLRLCAAGCRPGARAVESAANASAAGGAVWAPPRTRADEERLMLQYCAACS